MIKKCWINEGQDLATCIAVRHSVFHCGDVLRSIIRKHHDTKLLLVVSVILVALFFDKLPISFFDFEIKAFKPPILEGSQNNADVQLGPNNSSSNVSALVDQGNALLSQGKYAQAIQRYDEVLTIDGLIGRDILRCIVKAKTDVEKQV